MPLSPEGFANSLLTNYSARNKKSPKTHISLVFMLFFQLYSTNIIEHLRVNVSSLQEKFSRMKTPSISLWFSDFYIQNLLFSSFFPCHSLLFIPIFHWKTPIFLLIGAQFWRGRPVHWFKYTCDLKLFIH